MLKRIQTFIKKKGGLKYNPPLKIFKIKIERSIVHMYKKIIQYKIGSDYHTSNVLGKKK